MAIAEVPRRLEKNAKPESPASVTSQYRDVSAGVAADALSAVTISIAVCRKNAASGGTRA
jgi:hypothetical protein